MVSDPKLRTWNAKCSEKITMGVSGIFEDDRSQLTSMSQILKVAITKSKRTYKNRIEDSVNHLQKQLINYNYSGNVRPERRDVNCFRVPEGTVNPRTHGPL